MVGMIALLFSNVIYGQYDTDYIPLKSSGDLPEEFLKTARALSQEDLKTIGYGTDRIAKEQFIISSNSHISCITKRIFWV